MDDLSGVMVSAIPMIKTVVGLVLIIGVIIGIGWFIFQHLLTKKWITRIWEQKADGKLTLITIDVLIEKKVNGGKQILYWLRRQRQECFPPPTDSVHRVRGKEYVDYLRIEDEYIPMVQKLTKFNNLPNEKKGILTKIKQKMSFIKRADKQTVKNKFCYIPIAQALSANFTFDSMDYDVKMMRINAIDLRDKVYQAKQDWMQKYGHFVAIGFIVVLIIVVLYFSYDYSTQVINAGLSSASSQASALEALAAKIGGTVPPS